MAKTAKAKPRASRRAPKDPVWRPTLRLRFFRRATYDRNGPTGHSDPVLQQMHVARGPKGQRLEEWFSVDTIHQAPVR